VSLDVLLQRLIHARLPAFAGRFEILNDFGAVSNRNRYLCRQFSVVRAGREGELFPWPQYLATASASLGSYGHSESFTFSGAAAIAAAICSLLKVKGSEVRARFMFITVTTGNHSGAVIALHPNQKDNAIAKPTQGFATAVRRTARVHLPP
jgi:hypothetical protein